MAKILIKEVNCTIILFDYQDFIYVYLQIKLLILDKCSTNFSNHDINIDCSDVTLGVMIQIITPRFHHIKNSWPILYP